MYCMREDGFSSNIVKQTTGVKLDEAGFGILCEAIDRGTAKTLYSWSSNQDGKYEDMNIDGSNKAPEYSAVKIGALIIVIAEVIYFKKKKFF